MDSRVANLETRLTMVIQQLDAFKDAAQQSHDETLRLKASSEAKFEKVNEYAQRTDSKLGVAEVSFATQDGANKTRLSELNQRADDSNQKMVSLETRLQSFEESGTHLANTVATMQGSVSQKSRTLKTPSPC